MALPVEAFPSLVTGFDQISPADILLAASGLPPLEQRSPTTTGIETYRGAVAIGGMIVPYVLKTPNNPSCPYVYLPLHGWLSDAVDYEALQDEMAARGIPSAVGRYPRHRFGPHVDFDPTTLPSKATWGVMKDIKRRDPSVEGFVLSGHSCGGTVATRVAKEHPRDVVAVHNIASVGEDDNSPEAVALRIPNFIAYELIPYIGSQALNMSPKDRVKSVERAVIHWFRGARSPLRTLLEGLDAGGCNIRPDYDTLDRLGIPVATTHASSDTLLPPSESTRSLKVAFNRELGPHAGHLAPQVHTREVADTQLEALVSFGFI